MNMRRKWRLQKHFFTVFFFGLLCFLITLYSVSIQFEKPSQDDKDDSSRISQSFFKNAIFYFSDGNLSLLSLHADETVMNQNDDTVYFFGPYGTTYSQSGIPIHYHAGKGLFKTQSGELHLDFGVELISQTNKLQANKMSYYRSEGKIVATGEVQTQAISEKTKDKIVTRSDSLISWPQKSLYLFKGEVQGEIQKYRAYEQGMEFAADDAKIDLLINKIFLNQNVVLTRPNIKAQAHRGEILLDNYNKKLKYFSLFDDVRLKEKVQLGDGQFLDRKAYCEQLDGVMVDRLLILTGLPKVYQGQDKLTGTKMVLRENEESIEVDDANSLFKLKAKE